MNGEGRSSIVGSKRRRTGAFATLTSKRDEKDGGVTITNDE